MTKTNTKQISACARACVSACVCEMVYLGHIIFVCVFNVYLAFFELDRNNAQPDLLPHSSGYVLFVIIKGAFNKRIISTVLNSNPIQ